jgi:hypothetical protein
MVQIEQSELIAASISRVAPPATRKRPAQTRPVGLARISRCRHVVRSPTSKEKFVNEPLPHCCAQGEFANGRNTRCVPMSQFFLWKVATPLILLEPCLPLGSARNFNDLDLLCRSRRISVE